METDMQDLAQLANEAKTTSTERTAPSRKLVVTRETIRRMTPAPREIGFACSTIDTDEMMNIFLAAMSRTVDLEVVGQ